MYFEPLLLSSLRKTTSSFNSTSIGLEFHPQMSIREMSGAFRFAQSRDG